MPNEHKFELGQRLKKEGDAATEYLVTGISVPNKTYSIKGGPKGKEVFGWAEAEKDFKPVGLVSSTPTPPAPPATGGLARL